MKSKQIFMYAIKDHLIPHVSKNKTIMDVINDLLIPHISKKKTVKEMSDALISFYEREKINGKMILHNKLKSLQMIRSYIVTKYLIKIMQIHDLLMYM